MVDKGFEVSQTFGIRKHRGGPFFGRQIPALPVSETADADDFGARGGAAALTSTAVASGQEHQLPRDRMGFLRNRGRSPSAGLGG
jgi:hypothetical protein